MLWSIAATALITVIVVVIAMNFATPEKKIERRIAHIYDAASPQFRREMSVMLGPTIVGGNRVRDLQNGREIFPEMLAAIRAATRSIGFETYIYWSGKPGREFAEALAERAQEGVKVCVLLDWVGSLKMDDELIELMQRSGVEVKRYRPLHWYNLGKMNNRTHRKLLIVDGRIAFTGGVGIADPWDGDAQDPDHWRDIHFKVEGPVILQFQAAFNDNWIKTTGTLLNGADYFPPAERAGESDAHLFISSPAGGSESMHLMYLLSIAAAVREIDLQAAYFVPDRLIVKSLLAARRRGVRLRIMVPGKHIDSEIVRVASKAAWGELLQAGVEIYEYLPTMMHNKMLIIDEEMVSVGSTNFDVRSFRLNDEASLNIYDPAFARRMTAVFEQDLERCRRYDYAMWKRRPLKQRFFETLVRPFKSQL